MLTKSDRRYNSPSKPTTTYDSIIETKYFLHWLARETQETSYPNSTDFGTLHFSAVSAAKEVLLSDYTVSLIDMNKEVRDMKTMTIQMNVPIGMAPYLTNADSELVFARNAMMLYPLIQNLTISHGRAAEILGVYKTDLIEFYGTMGIPYLDQTEDEFLHDVYTIERLLGVTQ